jgi:hypothetical protein
LKKGKIEGKSLEWQHLLKRGDIIDYCSLKQGEVGM